MPAEATESPRIIERSRTFVWAIPVMVAVGELLAHLTMRSRVPEPSEYRAATHFVAGVMRSHDQVLASPGWIDPLVRAEIGTRMGIARAGSLDLEEWNRVFVVSIRGHRPPALVGRVPQDERNFGNVTVSRYDLGPSPVLYDFVPHWTDAKAEFFQAGVSAPCPRVQAPGRGGGLGQGDYIPSDRMACDPGRPWMYFAPTINEDLDLALRRCLFQHPSGPEPFRVTYENVPLGLRLVVDADIYYENERNEMHGFVPFELRVRIDGRDVGTMRHFDGQGRKRMVIETQAPGSDPWHRGTISFETTTSDPSYRGVCWNGSTRLAPRNAGDAGDAERPR